MSSTNQSPPRKSRFWPVVVVTICLGALVFAVAMVYTYRGESQPRDDSGIGGSGSRRSSSAFDLSGAIIPREEIHAGGPPKDGIPALTNPKMVSAGAADYLAGHDRVIGVTVGGEARAYPLKILNYHEIVNDRVGGQPVAVTYCPLCDSSVVFDRRDGDRVREFGVSGLLFNSNVLMYDRGADTESLWSQMMIQGVSGPGANENLKTIPMELTTWSDWRARYPKTKVLSVETGHHRDYQRSPYEGYFADPQNLMFPVNKTDDRLPLKALVLGVWTDEAAKAFPLTVFDENRTALNDQLDGLSISLHYNPKANSLRVERADDGVQWVYAYWFAWYAFHPDTDVYRERDG